MILPLCDGSIVLPPFPDVKIENSKLPCNMGIWLKPGWKYVQPGLRSLSDIRLTSLTSSDL